MPQIISRILLFLSTGLILMVFGCKEERSSVDVSTSEGDAAQQWLKDYVSPDLLWGFIDTAGQVVIPPKYDDVRDFKEGIAIVNQKGKWGYIDTAGKLTIGFKYLNAYEFNSGKALVQNFDKKYAYINLSGEKLFDCPGHECASFDNNFAIYKVNEFYGVLDHSGKITSTPQFTSLKHLSDGRFIAALGGNYGVIDSKGKWLISPIYQKIYPGSEGMMKVKKEKQYYYLDEKSLVQLIGPFDEAGDFSAGHTFVRKNGKYTIIDKKGQTIYQGQGSISGGGEGKWIEKMGNDSRFIEYTGKPISSLKFDQAFIFHEGIAGFSQGESWGYVNSSGVVIIPPSLPIIWDCSGSRIRFISESGYGYLDKAGKVVIAPKYPEARDFTGGYARISGWAN